MSEKRTAPAPTDAAQSRAAAKPLDSAIVSDLDSIHTAWLAGWTSGYAQGRQQASEELARHWLHEQAKRWTEQATQTAEANHGPGWSTAIRKQAEAVA